MTKSQHSYYYLVLITGALLPLYIVRGALLGVPTNIWELIVEVIIIVGVLQSSVRTQWKHAWHGLPQPVKLFGVVFIAAIITSTIISSHPQTSIGIVKGWIIIPALYAFAVHALPLNFRSRIPQFLIASGVVVALIGISQIGTLDRAHSIYDVPNSLALFLVPLIVLAVVHQRWYWPAFIMSVALIATKSVAGISTALVVGTLASITSSSRFHFTKYKLLAATTILLAAAMVMIPKTYYLLQPGSSAFVRLQLWDISAELIHEHPIRGIGLGVFESAYQQKLHERFQEAERGVRTSQPLPEFVLRDPHNWILSFWLNTGLLGLLAFTGVHAWIFWRYQPWQTTHYALLALIVFGLVDTIVWKNDLSALHITLIALTIAHHQPAHYQ